MLITMSLTQTYQSGQVTSLAVYNLPSSADETEVQSVFPSARSVNFVRSHSVSSQSRGMCILQFNNARDCQQAYDECLQGKEIGGQLVHAELNGGESDIETRTITELISQVPQ
uniref:RRM domain-containing protein n=1 Tax=Schistosoma mansoni TaxID=6183 RepID=A0A146MIE7_SCHMA